MERVTAHRKSRKAAPAGVPLRTLVLSMAAGGVGLLAWRFPGLVNPVLVALALYALLERMIRG